MFIWHSVYGNTYSLNILEQSNKETSHELLIVVPQCRKIDEHKITTHNHLPKQFIVVKMKTLRGN